jgi:hypothetical protein
MLAIALVGYRVHDWAELPNGGIGEQPVPRSRDGSGDTAIRTLGCSKKRWEDFDGRGGACGGWEPNCSVRATMADASKKASRDCTSQTAWER